jgi:hypothetical protein
LCRRSSVYSDIGNGSAAITDSAAFALNKAIKPQLARENVHGGKSA